MRIIMLLCILLFVLEVNIKDKFRIMCILLFVLEVNLKDKFRSETLQEFPEINRF